jgi:putative transposase
MSTPKHRISSSCSYFVTTKCGQGRTIFQIPALAQICLEAIFHYRDQGAYLLHEFVIMPDHLHLLLTPGATTSLERAMQLVKGGSSHRIHRAQSHTMQIWQDGFFDWTIRDESDWRIKANYIRMNPVKAGLIARAEDWKFGSANGRFVMDDMPRRYSGVSSGAEAPISQGHVARGLKPPPPGGRV